MRWDLDQWLWSCKLVAFTFCVSSQEMDHCTHVWGLWEHKWRDSRQGTVLRASKKQESQPLNAPGSEKQHRARSLGAAPTATALP